MVHKRIRRATYSIYAFRWLRLPCHRALYDGNEPSKHRRLVVRSVKMGERGAAFRSTYLSCAVPRRRVHLKPLATVECVIYLESALRNDLANGKNASR